MGQEKAAAQRKLGFTARLYYLGFGAVALLWFVFYSFPALIVLKDTILIRETFLDLEGRIALQAAFLTIAGLCVSWFVLTGTRYSVMTMPRFLPKLEIPSILCFLLFYLCRIDGEGIAALEIPPLLYILIPIWGFTIFGGILEKIGGLLGKLPSFLWNFTLPMLIIGIPWGDLSEGQTTSIEAFWNIGVPFLIFALPAYDILGVAYIKEHPEYRKIFIFGRRGGQMGRFVLFHQIRLQCVYEREENQLCPDLLRQNALV